MTIFIRDVEDLLQARSLTNPSLDVLNPNDQSYRALLLQPAGPILADNTRIGPMDIDLADTQAMKFLELAIAKGQQLVVTPEYYLPIKTLVTCVQGVTFPAVGTLWVLGCESMTPAQLEKFEADCAGFCDAIFDKDTAAAVQGIYYDPVAYCFVTKDQGGNDRRVVLLQFKTISSRDDHFFENKNLRCGNIIYQFKGPDDVLSLSTIICSDAFNVASDEKVRSQLTRFATLIHIQLNPKPRHSDYLRYRLDTFSKNKDLNNCDIVCLNWAENMVQYDAPGGKREAWKNESGSAWYISDHRCSSNDDEVDSNERLGLYYSKHVKHRHVLHFHFNAAAFELTVAKVVQTGSYLHDNHLGPKLDVRYTWDEAHQDWKPNAECPDPGLSKLFELTPQVGALASLKNMESRLQVERAIALSCGLAKSKVTWFRAVELDACKLGEDEIVRRITLSLDRDKQAREVREVRVKKVAALNTILSTQNLPRQIQDLRGGGAQVMWHPQTPHTNVFKEGSQPALVAYLGMDPSSDTVRNVSDAAYELLRLENNDKHKHRIAVCYHSMNEAGETRLEFANIPQLTDITHGGGSATSITEEY
ncbi:hypothetical protein [Janthinobacterium agaricidamnosum]|uniref:Uncharacterized protein n=1 Tax=Janthinobacterium agaricidamnosum NBRC 102515 = DSM 9628 TaxID=1349767 RepID=W0UYT5_9BURK|nr:hypothetical protein [Janthinobacterium agaricidamnosum]CDG80806.1 hypothetical protein GJA_140 [Janthinobacterium agaricidamnosum NBRC 102515 = DSM 9628]